MCMCICIWGRGLRFPEHRGTLSLAIQQHMCDLLIYRRVRGGGGYERPLNCVRAKMLFLFGLAYRRGRPLNCVRGKML